MKKQESVSSIAKLYKAPLPSTRSGPIYNAFPYPTKISPEAIAVYIATHTDPGATVLDAFAGSGTTGLAALLCDRPTPEMQRMAEDLGAKPKWGARNAQLFEIGVLGSFVSQTMCHPPEPEAFAMAVEELCRQAASKIGWLYAIKDVSGKIGTLRHAIWSDVLVCPHCATEVSLWDASVKTNPLAMADSYCCKGCCNHVAIEACERATEVVIDAFGCKQLTKKRVLARVHGRCGTAKWQRAPTDEDRELLSRIAKVKPPKSAPSSDIEWGELRRAGYHLGIEKLHHFYTKRNFIAMATMMELTDTGWALDLRGHALPDDIGAGDLISTPYQPMPEEVAAVVKAAAQANFGTPEKPQKIWELTAVAPNMRPAVRGAHPRYWYMLPNFAPRHLPDVLLARVNSATPKAYLNEGRECLVDANFCTLWTAEKSTWTAHRHRSTRQVSRVRSEEIRFR